MGLMDSAKDAVDSKKGEDASDSGIEKAEDFASDKTGGKFDDEIEKGGDAADDHIGND